jgi:hypothetical protein
LARRATFFKTIRSTSPAVFIGGGYEFAVPGTESDRHPAAIGKLKRAYDLLGYDIFLLSPADAEVLRNTNVAASPGWHLPLDAPGLVVKDVPGGRLAFVLFPDSGHPDPAMEENLDRFARALRDEGKYNLIVGVSTWGATRENGFIEQHDAVFDIVLGSGEGPGYAGLYLKDNKVLWVRSFTKGKSLLSVAMPALPPAGTKVVWSPEISVKTLAAPLGDGLPSDPEIQAIFTQ